MLSRAAARAASHQIQTPLAFRSFARSYAKVGKPKATQFVPGVNKAKAAAAAATGAARQTSPGTSLPKDETWKPQDSIKFASSQSPPSTVSSSGSQNAEFNTAADPSANTTPIQQPGPVPEQPHPSDPTPTSLKDSQSANVEFEGPQSAEANTAPETDPSSSAARAASQEQPPSTPLPDLRQGIPSTFDFEFGGKKASGQTTTEDKVVGQENADGTEAVSPFAGAAGGGGRRSGQDEQYDREAYETSLDRRRARLANYMYISLAALFLVGPAYLARPYGTDEEAPAGLAPEKLTGWSPGAMYDRVKSRMSSQMGYYTEPAFPKLLPELPPAQQAPYTLVLSLEDLMIHSSWDREHGWRTAKRPGLDYFLRYLSQYYELVVFTSVPVTAADPVIKKLDPFRIITWPLFREATRYEGGQYIKDLSYLNRPLERVIIVDTKAEHVKNQPENAIILPKWHGDPKDPHTKDLVALIPFLEYVASMGIEDARKALASFKDTDIPTEFARREGEARKVFMAKLEEDRARQPKRSLGGLLNNALGVKAQPGGMQLDNDYTVAEGLRQGKMLSDQIRERGQKEYERIDNEIRTNGAKWLKEMEEEEKKYIENASKEMKSSWFGFGAGKGAPVESAVEKRQA